MMLVFHNLCSFKYEPLKMCNRKWTCYLSLPRNSLANVPGYSSKENWLTFYFSSLILKVMLFQEKTTWLLGIVFLLGN